MKIRPVSVFLIATLLGSSAFAQQVHVTTDSVVDAVVKLKPGQYVSAIVGNVIYPRLQAQTQNIDPLATLAALGFWGILWGMAGAFLAVPLTLIGMMICMRNPSARWVAVLLSNDGKPTFPVAPARRAK